MNIYYNDSNFIIKYIQIFLQSEYSNDVVVSGVYDLKTHEYLIKYLQQPNIVSINDLYNILINTFPEIPQLFKSHISNEDITLESELHENDVNSFLVDNIEDMFILSKKLGWVMTDSPNFGDNVFGNIKYKINFNSGGRTNRFPNSDLLGLINIFDGNFINNFSINDSEIITADRNKEKKIAVIPCKENTVYTIFSQNASTNIVNTKIGVTEKYKNETEDSIVTGLEIKNKSHNLYTTEESFGNNKIRNLVIEIPKTYSVYENGEDNLPTIYENFLLVLDGDYSNYLDSISNEEYYKTPYLNYYSDAWQVHEKLVDYILDMTINPYSSFEDIYYLQNLIGKLGYKNIAENIGMYSVGLKDSVKSFQNTNNIFFASGYLDVETESKMIKQIYRNGGNI